MTMHLEGPWLSTTGRKKGPRKWASAEAKRRAELLQEEWEQRLGNFKKMAPKFSRTPAPPSKPAGTLKVNLAPPPGRETPRIESRDTGWVACVKHTDQTYTGTKVKGIGTMHKSNAVPIFTDDEARDISKMRR
jgi:N-acetylglucosamine-6-phosphate deacetylase